jgi:hypothetical protein
MEDKEEHKEEEDEDEEENEDEGVGVTGLLQDPHPYAGLGAATYFAFLYRLMVTTG